MLHLCQELGSGGAIWRVTWNLKLEKRNYEGVKITRTSLELKLENNVSRFPNVDCPAGTMSLLDT